MIYLHFGPGGRVHVSKTMHVCVVFTEVPGLMFTKLSANIEQVVCGLLNNFEIATARSRDVVMVTDL